MIEIKQRVIFVNKIHLFNGLKEEHLSGIASKMEEREVGAGKVVFQKGDKPDGFYIIFKGKVKVSRPKTDGDEFLAWLAAGDYFGEEALFENRNRSATITAVEPTTLLFISRKSFEELLAKFSNLKPNFLVAIKSRKLARATKFDWLGPQESIYFIARRHRLLLYQSILPPLLGTILPGLVMAWGVIAGSMVALAVAATAVAGLLGLTVWKAIDWSNDYYIVTNQRVVWLEKVIGVYDSREEAPLATILSVGVETDAIGRALDFGNVIVRTFVGKLEFDHVDHPQQAADMIREYWERTKAVTTQSQQEIMRDAIKQKLGLPLDKKKLPDLPPVVPDDKKVAQKSFWLLAFSNYFKMRVEDGGKVIYHKHWMVFLEQAWKAMGGFLLLLAAQIWRGVFLFQSAERSFIYRNSAGALRLDTISVVIPFLMLFPIGFAVWEYLDWKNDIFMLTQDEIFDIDRTPLGKEERRAAQIENILSTSYKREGILANIFNYGTVYITVGGTQMDFQEVLDPAGVQADINRRRAARIAKKNEDSGSADRERFATWIAAYHQNIQEFNAPVKTEKPAEKPPEKKEGGDAAVKKPGEVKKQ